MIDHYRSLVGDMDVHDRFTDSIGSTIGVRPSQQGFVSFDQLTLNMGGKMGSVAIPQPTVSG